MKQSKMFWLRFVVMLMICCVLSHPLSASAQTVQVIQIWNDAENRDGLRPDFIPVQATSADEAVRVSITDEYPRILPDHTYSFEQGPLPDGYTEDGSYVTNRDGVTYAVFINTHKLLPEKRTVLNTQVCSTLTIEKEADVADVNDLFTFHVTLDSSEDFTYITSGGRSGRAADGIKLHAGESAVIDGIPTGTAYSVEEMPDSRYQTTAYHAKGTIPAEGATATFFNQIRTKNFSVTKEWRGTPQDSIILQLYADGILIPDAEFVQEGNKYTVYDLPVFRADGSKIVYSATEKYMKGYMTMYLNVGEYKDRSLAVYDGGTIVNRETVDFSIQKQWMGISGNYPEVSFQLYQNGEPFVWRQPLPDEDGTYAWEYLPKMKLDEYSGEYVEARYYVVEKPMDGYFAVYKNVDKYSQITDRCYTGGTIINYKVPKTGDKAPIALWLVASGVGAVGLALLAGYAAKKRKMRK